MERKFKTANALVDALAESATKGYAATRTEAKAGALHAYLTFAVEALEKVVDAQDADTDYQAKVYGLQIAAEYCRDIIKYFEKKCTE